MRRYGLDWLRIIIVFMLFPFHTARVFDWWESNYVKDATNTFSSWFVASLGFWFMALMFVIAGFSSFHALQKRTPKEYIKERVLRLLVPLLFGLVLIVPVQGYYASLQHEGFTGDYFQFLRQYFTDFHDLSGYTGGFTPAHLWFILYLFVISLCLLPLLVHLRSPKKGRVRPWLWLLAFVPVTVMEALPDVGGKNPFFYAALFLLGFLLARNEETMVWVCRIHFATLAAAVILIPGYLMLAYLLGWPDQVDLLGASMALLRNLGVWMIVLALMGIAGTHMNKSSPVLNYLNGASYPVYVLHQSVLIVIAYYIVATDMPFVPKYLSIVLGALVACFALYEVFRHIPPMRFILGIKPPAKRQKKHADTAIPG